MSSKLGGVSVGILKGGKRKPKLLPPPVLESVPATQPITTLPELQPLMSVPGIEPFLTKELVPDLIYLYSKYGSQSLQEVLAKADPTDPSSFIFLHPLQEENRTTESIEFELIKNEPTVLERTDMVCECGSKKILTTTKQIRRAYEPATLLAQCVTCKRRWMH